MMKKIIFLSALVVLISLVCAVQHSALFTSFCVISYQTPWQASAAPEPFYRIGANALSIEFCRFADVSHLIPKHDFVEVLSCSRESILLTFMTSFKNEGRI